MNLSNSHPSHNEVCLKPFEKKDQLILSSIYFSTRTHVIPVVLDADTDSRKSVQKSPSTVKRVHKLLSAYAWTYITFYVLAQFFFDRVVV